MAAAAAECRHQFRGQRWNCGVLGAGARPGAQLLPTWGNVARGLPQGGYREVAFARAILAAGVVLQVAKECSTGLLSDCTCEPRGWASPWNRRSSARGRGGSGAHWKWRGCSRALDFGLAFSRELLDGAESAADAPSRVHLHNSNVGRLAVMSLVKVRCKCHGMSGSCALRTCWQAPPDLKQVALALKSRFHSAVMVSTDNMSGDLVIRGSATEDELPTGYPSRGTSLFRQRRGSSKTKGLDEQLLYIERSPSFCERDASADVPGTSGRRCRRDGIPAGAPGSNDSSALAMEAEATDDDEQDCAIMCCGRGFNLVKAPPSPAPSRCRCRFVWCCKVVCDLCPQPHQHQWVAVCK